MFKIEPKHPAASHFPLWGKWLAPSCARRRGRGRTPDMTASPAFPVPLSAFGGFPPSGGNEGSERLTLPIKARSRRASGALSRLGDLRRWGWDQHAAVAVELALVLPILATIFTAIITFGNIYQEQIAVQTGVAAAARTYAVSRGSTTPWSDAYNAFALASGFNGSSLQSNAFYNISGTQVTTYPLYLCFVFDQCCTNDTSCLSNANSILGYYQTSTGYYTGGYNHSGFAYNASTNTYQEYYGLSNFVFVDYPINIVLFGVNLCPNCYIQVQSQYRVK